MHLYCGIDLHSNNSMISLIDDHDQLISEKRLNNDLDAIHQHLMPYQDDISGIVVESTYNWYWLVDDLMDKGYPVHLANKLFGFSVKTRLMAGDERGSKPKHVMILYAFLQ